MKHELTKKEAKNFIKAMCNRENSNPITTGIVFADVHVPHEDRKALSVLAQVINDVNPNVIIDLGDTCDFPSVNHWLPRGSRKTEGQRIWKDLQRMYEFSKEVEEWCPSEHVRKVRLIGNHENWLARFIDQTPALYGTPNFNIERAYMEMGWHVVPFGEFHMEGKLAFHHGDRRGYQGKHHSAQWSLMGRSIVYAHRHDVQRFTHEVLRKDGMPSRHAAFSIGCLCKFDLDYMINAKVNWQQGFGVFYMNKAGHFGFYHVDINNGKAFFGGKEYRG